MQGIQINSYQKTSNTATQKAGTAATQKSGAMGKAGGAMGKAGGADLDMQDFLNLLSAQLTNQDVMNPSTDTEFIAQMAQFTSLQAMQTLTEISYAQYGAGMAGKNVIVASYDKKGNLETQTGVVSNVKFMNGVVSITVNGKEYDMSAVMEVLDKLPETEKPDTKPE